MVTSTFQASLAQRGLTPQRQPLRQSEHLGSKLANISKSASRTKVTQGKWDK